MSSGPQFFRDHPEKAEEALGTGKPWVSRKDLSKLDKVQDTTEMQTFSPLEDNKEIGATKFDGEKPMMHLFPMETAESIAKVLTFGAQKYAPNGWKKLPEAVQRYQGALLRHLTALQRGEEVDEDSGLPHIYHIGCNITFLIYFYNKDPEGFMGDIKV